MYSSSTDTEYHHFLCRSNSSAITHLFQPRHRSSAITCIPLTLLDCFSVDPSSLIVHFGPTSVSGVPAGLALDTDQSGNL